jgi:hypothetical protein
MFHGALAHIVETQGVEHLVGHPVSPTLSKITEGLGQKFGLRVLRFGSSSPKFLLRDMLATIVHAIFGSFPTV